MSRRTGIKNFPQPSRTGPVYSAFLAWFKTTPHLSRATRAGDCWRAYHAGHQQALDIILKARTTYQSEEELR